MLEKSLNDTFLPKGTFWKNEVRPGLCERSGRPVVNIWLVARAKPAIDIYLPQDDCPVRNKNAATYCVINARCTLHMFGGNKPTKCHNLNYWLQILVRTGRTASSTPDITVQFLEWQLDPLFIVVFVVLVFGRKSLEILFAPNSSFFTHLWNTLLE